MRPGHRCRVAGWAAALVALAALAGPPARADAPAPPEPWTAVQAASAAGAPELPGWRCRQRIDLPGTPATQAAVCRRSGDAASPELKLLLVQQPPDAAPPRELARLRDASQAELRLFLPPRPCAGSAPCLDGVLLVDQRDESSCYGTQVLVLAASRPPRPIGFIEEVRELDGSLACIGAVASVSGTADGVLISLPPPLLRMGRDGKPRTLPAGGVDYRIAAAKPALQRQVLRRATQ